jgi:L-rhamnose isomerase
MIPTYTFHNGRLRDYSEATILFYESLGSVMVRRRHGRIVSARFRADVVRERRHTPSRATALDGVRFTTLESVGERRRIVVHKRLPYAALSQDLTPAQRERVMRATFSAVQLSVMDSECFNE